MKKARLILSVTALATVGLFSVSTLSSCKKDKVCAVGFGGKDCNVEVRTAYNGTYAGNGMDNAGHNLNNWNFKFSPSGSDATHMSLTISNGSSAPLTLSVTLVGNSRFKIDPNATQTQSYSGGGNITGTLADITWEHSFIGANGTQYIITYTFPTLVRK
jgi:hypothetical protein